MDKNFTPLDWHRIMLGEAPPMFLAEIGLRILMLFVLLLLVVRLLGKREQETLSPMQQMLMIALGSAAGDVMLYPEVPIAAAAMILFGVALLTILLEKTASRFRPVRDYIESRPRILLRDGKVDFDALAKERTTRRELYAVLRSKGAVALSQVELAVLEVTGAISVVLNDSKPEQRDLIDYLLDSAKKPPHHDRAGSH
ncbi:DUF421 domain-containing protein [Piscinibacter sakaiensis]|uniref:DUF421 domain-containing protein n=1 Tax=Piscinibacter sakaiensis TaxID=1547922 RepID=UPI003AAD9AC7